MPTYQYSPLNQDAEEIRLVTLFPGKFDDPIQISIHHASFKIPDPSISQRLSIKELNDSLPLGWWADRTLEDRTLFTFTSPEGEVHTTWTHPDPSFARHLYQTREGEDVSLFTPKFEALSYAWGDSNYPKIVDVLPDSSPSQASGDSDLDRSVFEVRRNLDDALRHLRNTEETRTLWIDAICINQTDLTERDLQVKRMHHIYKFSHRVVAWLGLGSESSGPAFSMLDYIGHQIEYTIDRRFLPAPECDEPDLWKQDQAQRYDTITWQTVRDLIYNNYFQRLWVFQEIQLGSHRAVVSIGTVQIHWYHLRRALLLFEGESLYKEDLPPWAKSELLGMLKHVQHFALNASVQGMEKLVTGAMNSSCCDPRDRIYGLLGLLPTPIVHRIRPQYSQDASEVYKEAFLAFTECSNRLDLLGFAVSTPGSFRSLPTWVPNLLVAFQVYPVEQLNNAYGNSATQFTHIVPDMLDLEGVYHSTIEEVSEPLPDTDNSILAALVFLFSLPSHSSDTVSYTEAFIRVLSLGSYRNRLPKSSSLPWLDEAAEIFRRICEGVLPENRWKTWINELSHRILYQRVFRTDRGLIGIGTTELRPMDRVVVFLGCSVPLILRKESDDHFRVIGRCYLDGIMDGEVLLGPFSKPWSATMVRFMSDDDRAVTETQFFNDETQMYTREDPRLGTTSDEWTEVFMEDKMRSPYVVQHYRNSRTGELINSDPRLLPDALRARGVLLETFRLV